MEKIDEYNRNCPRCNKSLNYESKRLFIQAIKRNSICRSCRTALANMSTKRDMSLQNNPAWKGFYNIPYSWFSNYFERGKGKKKRTGNITIEDVYLLWIKQDKKCALSGVEIGWNSLKTNGHTCSIDRIDSNREYVLDNIQLVHKDINRMKSNFSQPYFIKMCDLISKTCPIK